MSDADICSDDEKYGGFGAAMANSVAADSAAPARAVAAVRIWKTKDRSKRPKKSNVPAHVLQAAVPAPVPLVAVGHAAARAAVEMKSPPVLPPAASAEILFLPLGIFNSYVSLIQIKIFFGTICRISRVQQIHH